MLISDWSSDVCSSDLVKAQVIAVSTDIDGRVIGVPVRNDQRVKAGDVLFRLDPDPYWLQLQIADARIATVRNEIDAMRAAFRQSEAELGEAMATVRYFEREAGRQRRLATSGAGPAAQIGRASCRERVCQYV